MSAGRSTLQITLRHGIWRICLDGLFYGDYRSKGQAIESAEEAVAAMAATGRLAVVVVAPD